MKKLLSICFLSILLAALSFTAQAQSSPSCCFWLENLQPATLTGLSNTPGGSLELNNTLSPAVRNTTHYYKVRFNNSCNLPANTKVALDLKLYRDGILISEDPATLSQYATVAVYTRWDGIVTSNTPGTVNCGQMSWFGGSLNSLGTCAVHGNVCEGGYPGSTNVHSTHPWSSTSTEAQGPMTIGQYGFDYFYLNFFEQSENIIAITWKQVAQNLSLVVGLREKVNGTDNTQYFGNNEMNHIGGHQSACGALLAQDSIHYLVKSHFEKEVCDGSSFDYGNPIHTFTEEGDYLVAFYAPGCGGQNVVERVDTLHFFTRINPEVVVSTTHVERCFTHDLTPAELASFASFQQPDAPGMTSHEIQWSTDNVNFTTTVPTPGHEVGTYNYYVRQSNTYFNFLDSVVCEGPSKMITYKVNAIPATPEVGTHNYYYCVDHSNGVNAVSVDQTVTASDSCHLVWALDRNFDAAISGDALMPSLSNAGVTTYYVYQINDTTGCTGLDLNHIDSVVVTVYANPEVNTTVEPTFVCQGETIHVEAVPAIDGAIYTYLWGDGRTSASFDTVPAEGNHIYTVTAFQDHEGLDADKRCQATFNTIADTVNYNPLVPELAVSSVEYCNETIDANTTYTMSATVGEHGTVCVWFDEAGLEIARGASKEVNVQEIMPATNVNGTVKYFVKSYNENTGCWSKDSAQFTFIFHQTPVLMEIVSSNNDSICPMSATVTLSVDFETETTSPYTFTWAGSVNFESTSSGENKMFIDETCDSTYSTSVFVTDYYGCKSTVKEFSIIAKDHTPLTLTPDRYTHVSNVAGCDYTAIDAPVDNIVDFEHLYDNRISNACGGYYDLTVTSNDVEAGIDDNRCVSKLVRTYTITDHCGNAINFTDTFYVKDVTNPVINVSEPIAIEPIRVQDCKFNAPETSVLKDALIGKLSDNCATADELMASVEFYYAETNNRFEGATDLFASSDIVKVDAKITDRCGNATTQTVIYLKRPDRMYIAENSISIDYNFICKQDPDFLNRDSINLTFDSNYVRNAFSPYSFAWSQIPDEGEIADVNSISTLARPTRDSENYRYVMTVTDKYGCVYSDTSSAVHVYPVITVNIHANTLYVPGEWVDLQPLCPNTDYVLTASCTQYGIWDDSQFNFVWSQPGHETYDYGVSNNTTHIITPNTCSGLESFQVLATASVGCKAIGRFSVEHKDIVAPVINADVIHRETTVSRQEGCKMYVPDFTRYLNANNTTDNCVVFESLTVTQLPLVGTEMTENTQVIVTVTDPCGNFTTLSFTAKIPENMFDVEAVASNYAFCEDTVLSLTANPLYAFGTVTYSWTEAGVSVGTNNPQTVVPTATEDEVQHTYIVVAVDGNNCTAADTVTVTTYRKPTVDDVQLTSTPNHYCDNESNIKDGTVTATLTDDFGYKISDISFFQNSGYLYENLYQGTYNVDVITNHGCVVYNLTNVTVERDTLSTVYAQLDQSPLTDCVNPNGKVFVTDVKAGYTYTLNNANGVVETKVANTDNDFTFEGLLDGSYFVTVLTDKLCEYTLPVTVEVNKYFPQASDVTLASTPNTYCSNGQDGTISVTNLRSGYMYKMSTDNVWHNASYVYENLYQDTYRFDLKSDEGCVSDTITSAVVVRDTTETVYAVLTTISNTRCELPYNGIVTVSNPVVGYTYTLVENADTRVATSTNTIDYTQLYFGNYNVDVVTDKYCQYSKSITVDSAAVMPIRPQYYSNPFWDCARPNGTLSLTNGGVVENYTYTLQDVTPTQFVIADRQDTITFYGLRPGFYSIAIETPMACKAMFSGFEVGSSVVTPADPNPIITPDNACDESVANGTLTIGSPIRNYSYVLMQGSRKDSVKALTTNSIVFNNLKSGDENRIVMIVYSEVGCSKRFEYDVDWAPIYPAFADNELVVTPRSSCDVANGELTIDRVPGFTYRVDSLGQEITSLNTLDAVEYVVFKTDNALLCVTTDTVKVPTSYYLSQYDVTVRDNSYCDNIRFDGMLTFSNDSLTYTVFNAAGTDVTTVNANGQLPAGIYTVKAVNNYTGCTAEQKVDTVTNDRQIFPNALAQSTANYVCANIFNVQYDGTVTFIPDNSTSIDTFILNGVANQTGYFENLNSGTYEYTLISTKGCKTTANIAVVDSAFIPNVVVSKTSNYACDSIWVLVPGRNEKTLEAGNGSISFDSPRDLASEGTMSARYTYSFTAPEYSQMMWRSNTYQFLGAGSYEVQVLDSTTRCVAKRTVDIVNDRYEYTLSLTPTVNTICEGVPFNGTITAQMSTDNANAVYTYAINAAGHTNPFSNVFTGLEDGNYTVTVRDTTLNCYYQANTTVEFAPYEYDFTASVVRNNNMCSGTPNGMLTVKKTGGNANGVFTYKIAGRHTSTFIDWQSDSIFNNLPADTFSVYMKDATTGCVYNTAIYVGEELSYPAFEITPTHNSLCTELGDGSLEYTAAPGANYTYRIYKNEVSPVTEVANGQLTAHSRYVVRATDNNTNCYTDSIVAIDNSARVYPVVQASSTPDYMCSDDNGSLNLSVTNITDSCYFDLLVFGAPVKDKHSHLFLGLESAVYNYKVTSLKGCKSEGSYTVIDSAHIYSVSVETTPDFVCQDATMSAGNGTITFTVTNPANHSFSGAFTGTHAGLDNATDNVFSNLADGSYNFVIADLQTGCTKDLSAVVDAESYTVTRTYATTADSVCVGTNHNGSITVTAVSNNTNAQLVYALDNGDYQSNATFNGVTAGKHQITVKDNNVNCYYVDSVTVNQHEFTPAWNVTATPNYNCLHKNGTINVAFTDMPAHTYQYAVTTRDYQSSPVFENLTPTIYSVSVKDMNTGCVYETSIQVADSSNSPIVDLSSVNYSKRPFQHCYGTQGAKIVASATSRVPNDTCFTFDWRTLCEETIVADSNEVDLSSLEHHCTIELTVTSCLTGCQTVLQQYVHIDSLPVVSFLVDYAPLTSANNYYYSCENDAHTISINYTLDQLDSIRWNETAGNVFNRNYIVANPLAAGSDITYCVKVWDHNGCTLSPMASITLYYKDTTHTAVFDTICRVEAGAYVHNGKTEMLTYNTGAGANNNYVFMDTLTKVNGCDSIITYNVTLNGAPTLELDEDVASQLDRTHCAGDTILRSGTGFSITSGGATVTYGWKVRSADTINLDNDVDFDIHRGLTLADNDKSIYAWVKNCCSEAFSDVYTLIVSDTVSNIVFNPTTLYCHNNDFNMGAVVYDANVNDGSSVQVTVQFSSNQTEWVDKVDTFPVSFDHNNGYVRLKVTNCCGSNYSDAKQITVDTLPYGTLVLTQNTFCAGDTLKQSIITLDTTAAHSVTAPITASLYVGSTPFTVGNTLAYTDNGANVYYTLSNRCGAGSNTNAVAITVNDKPALAHTYVEYNTCRLEFNLENIVADNMGTPITDSAWYISTASGFQRIDIDDMPVLSNNGKQIFYSVTNACGTSYSDTVDLMIYDIPVVHGLTANIDGCSEGLALPRITIDTNYSSLWTSEWQYKRTSSTTWTSSDSASIVALAAGNYDIRYVATNECGGDTVAVKLSISNVPVITDINSIDTCQVGFETPTITVDTMNAATTYQWQVKYTGDWSNTDAATIPTLAPGNYQLRYIATNRCGADTMTVNFTYRGIPEVTELNALDTCRNATTLAVPSINNNNADLTTQTWLYKLNGNSNWTAQSNLAAVQALTDGNYAIKYVAGNICGLDTTEAVSLIMRDLPVISGEVNYYAQCKSGFNLAPVAVDTNNSALTTHTWQYLADLEGAHWTTADSSYITTQLSAGDYMLRYVAGNRCGYDTSSVVTLQLQEPAEIVTDLAATITSCRADFATSLTTPSVDTNNAATTTSWQVKLVGSSSWGAKTLTQIADLDAANYDVRFIASNNCGNDTTATLLKLQDKPSIASLSRIETCKASFTLTTPAIDTNNNVLTASYWEYRNQDSAQWISNATTQNVKNLVPANYYLRYYAANGCGETRTDSVEMILRDIPVVAIDVDAEMCKSSWSFSSNVDYQNSFVTSQYWTLDDDSMSQEIMDSPVGVYTLDYVAKNACGTSASVAQPLTIMDAPEVSTPHLLDTCSADLTSYTLAVPAIDTNYSTVVAQGWKYKNSDSSVWISAATGDFVRTLAPAKYDVLYWAKNACDSSNSASVTINVRDIPTLSGHLVLDTNCAYMNFSAQNTPTVNYNNGLNNGAKYEYSETLDFTSAIQITSDSSLNGLDSVFVRYNAYNDCGHVYSDTVMLVVKDFPTLLSDTLRDTVVCANVDIVFTEPSVNWHHSEGTAWFQMSVNGSEYVDTTSTMVFTYGNTYSIQYVAMNDCAEKALISGPVTVTVNDKPSFVLAPIQRICDGKTFTLSVPTVDLRGALGTDTTWYISKPESEFDEMDVEAGYNTDYNEGQIMLAVTNVCGTSYDTVDITVDTLPIPYISGDTTICLNGTATINVVSPLAGDCSYQWFVNNAAQVGETGTTFEYTPVASMDDVHSITVTVTDGLGCVSDSVVNVNTDVDWGAYNANAVSVMITDNPRFIFRDAAGNVTHRLPATVTNASNLVNYSWTVTDPCGTNDERVFVTFELYRNGCLVPTDSLGIFFQKQTTNTSSPWVTRQSITYDLTVAGNTRTYDAYYDAATYNNHPSGVYNISAMGNHFPAQTRGSESHFDYYYMHLISSRYINVSSAPVLMDGEYKFVYKLWSTSNVNEISEHYFNGVAMPIGGTNALSSMYVQTLIMSDSLMLTVTGETIEPEEAPVAPVAPETDDQPTMTVYPNPTSGAVTVDVDGLYGNTVVTIATLDGTVLATENIFIDLEENFIYSCSLDSYEPGMYLIRFMAENGIVSKKITVTR